MEEETRAQSPEDKVVDIWAKSQKDEPPLTDAERAITTIPPRFLWFPPSRLPNAGAKLVENHRGVTLRSSLNRITPPHPRHSLHTHPGWYAPQPNRPIHTWSNLLAADREAYILWWGRWYAASVRQSILQEEAEAIVMDDEYLLHCMQEAGHGLLCYYAMAKGTASVQDLSAMVRMYLFLTWPPITRAEEDSAVRLGPPPAEARQQAAPRVHAGTALPVAGPPRGALRDQLAGGLPPK